MIKTASLLSSTSRSAGGLFYSVSHLARSIEPFGFEGLEVLGLRDKFTREDAPTWNPTPMRAFPTLGPKAYGYSRQLHTAVMAGDFELLHNHGLWMYPSTLALQWWKRTRKPYLVSPHGMLDPWALKNSQWKKSAANALFQREHLQRAACLISLCASETRAIRKLGFKQPVCQIPNGVDLPAPGPAGPPPWALHTKKGDRILLYLGRLHPKKGLPILVEAFSRAWKAGGRTTQDWRLVIAGWDQGRHEALLKRLTRNWGMENRILFTGPLFERHKEAAFRACEAFVLPSLSEGLPIVVLEAWSYGRPVLMTPECNLPEGFLRGAAMEISSETRALEQSLGAFFKESPADHEAMGRKGRALVEEKFSWQRIGRDMAAVYLWLLKRGPMPSCVVP